MKHIVKRELAQLKAQLQEQGHRFKITPSVTTWLCQKGFDSALGARPLKRLIHEAIKVPLADLLLECTDANHFTITTHKGEIVIKS